MKPQNTILSAACVAAVLLDAGFSAFSAEHAPGVRLAQAGRQSQPPADARKRAKRSPDDRRRDARAKPPRTGVVRYEPGAFEGYTLFAPIRSTTTYLIDMPGNVVHSWKSDTLPGHAVYLLENGSLLRCAREQENQTFRGGGLGGGIQELAWDGTVVWEFVYSNDQRCQHHDIEPLPNGNVLLIAWERKGEGEAIAAGRDPALLQGGELWPDHIVEVQPCRPRGGTVVWEWHVWDHLIQDHDPAKANFGVVPDHPELIDLNFVGQTGPLSPEERRRLEALGYMPPSSRPSARQPDDRDWSHVNAVAYNAGLDQIALTVLGFNEVWVIDHSTTTEEAAGHTGGRSGKGGDILYRWGNPRAYRTGSVSDQQLFAHHDAHWIAPGLSGAGNLLVFNNGCGRPDGLYSSVDEVSPPADQQGRYVRKPGTAFGPAKPVWSYTAPEKTSFLSKRVSGAQRLPNGNTLICAGESGRFFEIDATGRIVWEYINPFGRGTPERPPRGRPGSPPRASPDSPSAQRPRTAAEGPPYRPPGRRPGDDRPRHDRRRATDAGAGPVFRAIRLPADYPGLAGRDLSGRGP